MNKSSNLKSVGNILDHIDKIETAINKAKDTTEKEAPKKAKKEIEFICWSAITTFYDEYDPMFYKRTFSLLKSYCAIPEDGYVNFKLSADNLSGHRATNGYIFRFKK